jgi:hypothetical protein
MIHRSRIDATPTDMHSPKSEGLFAGYSRLLGWDHVT